MLSDQSSPHFGDVKALLRQNPRPDATLRLIYAWLDDANR